MESSLIRVEGKRIICIQEYISQMKLEQIDQRTLEKHSKQIGRQVYEFRVFEAAKKWKIRKTLKDILVLERLVNGKEARIQEHKETKSEWYLSYLADRISSLAKSPLPGVQTFLERSSVEYDPEEVRFKEQYIYKRAGGRELSCTKMLFRCQQLFGCWSLRYMSISNEGVFYHKGHEQAYTRESILFDSDFSLLYGKQATRDSLQINIISSKRKLCIKALSLFQFYDLLFSLKSA